MISAASGTKSSSAFGTPPVSPVPSQARKPGTSEPVAITVRW